MPCIGPYLANCYAQPSRLPLRPRPGCFILLLYCCPALRDFSDPSAWSTERVEMHALLSVTSSTPAFRAGLASMLGLFGWRRDRFSVTAAPTSALPSPTNSVPIL
jgi:hypothetical protein